MFYLHSRSDGDRAEGTTEGDRPGAGARLVRARTRGKTANPEPRRREGQWRGQRRGPDGDGSREHGAWGLGCCPPGSLPVRVAGGLGPFGALAGSSRLPWASSLACSALPLRADAPTPGQASGPRAPTLPGTLPARARPRPLPHPADRATRHSRGGAAARPLLQMPHLEWGPQGPFSSSPRPEPGISRHSAGPAATSCQVSVRPAPSPELRLNHRRVSCVFTVSGGVFSAWGDCILSYFISFLFKPLYEGMIDIQKAVPDWCLQPDEFGALTCETLLSLCHEHTRPPEKVSSHPIYVSLLLSSLFVCEVRTRPVRFILLANFKRTM